MVHRAYSFFSGKMDHGLGIEARAFGLCVDLSDIDVYGLPFFLQAFDSLHKSAQPIRRRGRWISYTYCPNACSLGHGSDQLDELRDLCLAGVR